MRAEVGHADTDDNSVLHVHEEAIFVEGADVTVSDGSFVPVPKPVPLENTVR